jgi:hypothetical protein
MARKGNLISVRLATAVFFIITAFTCSYLLLQVVGLDPSLLGEKVHSMLMVRLGRLLCIRLCGSEVPLFLLFFVLSGGLEGYTPNMMDPAGGQPAANPAAEQPSDGASTSGEPAADSWKSFDERVLLEPMPDSSASSVNGPSHTEAADSAQTSVDPNLDPEELIKKKVELHTLVREQLRHYCERGLPKWQLYNEEEVALIYSGATDQILSGLEIGSSVSEHEDWIDHLRSNPTTLYELFKGYKFKK